MPGPSPATPPDPNATLSRRQQALRALWVALGGISLLLGVIGIFLPVLPTTPFVLLAAACFARGSQRFHEWLLGHPRFGPLVSDWQRHRSIPFKAKCLALSMMWVSMGTTAWMLRGRPLASAALLACAVGVSVWMVRLPTRPAEGGKS
ncbi:YbaN family protein [Cupriavidus lacunae]|uniref:YbaN family protein n=1 Tax=Cupriavidus lacunae TaxID=2666307 RepID=UPI00142E5F92|nr:YbaN family protein [Cupriavidus lacunae]